MALNLMSVPGDLPSLERARTAYWCVDDLLVNSGRGVITLRTLTLR